MTAKERRVNDLIKKALATTDSDKAWECVAALHKEGSREVLDAACALSRSTLTAERTLAADILGQLGVPERSFPNECVKTLLDMLSAEKDEEVLNSIGVALGHLDADEAVDALAALRNHPSSRVRFGVAFALVGRDSDTAIDTLLYLMHDEDAEVRDWATFGIGTESDIDSPDIRNALAAQLADPDEDVRAEAIMGLALRKDDRAVPATLQELAQESVHVLVLEAASELGDPRLYEALVQVEQRHVSDDSEEGEYFDDVLEEALEACDPSRNRDEDNGEYSDEE